MKKEKVSPRARRRNEGGKAQRKNKKALRLRSRLNGYFATIEKLGYSGSNDPKTLPKRWGGFNKPGAA